MHTTRFFKNGNLQAVHIPADLAYERTDIKLEIEREGNEIWIRRAPRRFECNSVSTPVSATQPLAR
jgi:antitoxin VapB